MLHSAKHDSFSLRKETETWGTRHAWCMMTVSAGCCAYKRCRAGTLKSRRLLVMSHWSTFRAPASEPVFLHPWHKISLEAGISDRAIGRLLTGLWILSEMNPARSCRAAFVRKTLQESSLRRILYLATLPNACQRSVSWGGNSR